MNAVYLVEVLVEIITVHCYSFIINIFTKAFDVYILQSTITKQAFILKNYLPNLISRQSCSQF